MPGLHRHKCDWNREQTRTARLPSLLAVMLLVLAVAGCGPDVRSDYDRSADFSRYRTYGFEPRWGTETGRYESVTAQRVRAAVTRELEQRGYAYRADNPDLLVNFSGRLQDKVEVTQTPIAGYYGYRVGFYGPWPGYAYATQVDQYTEGTLNIDLIDRARRQMVWEGVAVGRVSRAMRDAPQQAIDNAVREIFAKYPFRAGPRPP